MHQHILRLTQQQMIARLEALRPLYEGSPLHALTRCGNSFAKLEYMLYSGSIKDRPAFRIVYDAVVRGEIHSETTLVESSSGNFAVALAFLARALQIDFVPVIDPNIALEKKRLLQILTDRQIEVTERDSTGGFLLNRIKAVKRFCQENLNVYNPNQYENHGNFQSYHDQLASEIIAAFPRLDRLFVGVSSCGTVSGLSVRLKKAYPEMRVIAIDVEGSAIFSDYPRQRSIPGLGSSIKPPLLTHALIDEVVILSEREIVDGCRLMLRDEGILGGPSAGAVYLAARRAAELTWGRSVLIFPDRGNAYLETIFNDMWTMEHVERDRAAR